MARRARALLGSVMALIAGCGAHAAGRGGDLESRLVTGELSGYFRPGAPTPPPGPFQLALLKKSSLTFADYQSAMQAAADCIRKREPEETVRLVPQPGYGGRVLGVDLERMPSGDAGPTTNAAVSAPTGSPSAAAPIGAAPAERPKFVRDVLAAEGYCLATYSVRVEAKWLLAQRLSTSQLAPLRSKFLACMSRAGITVPANASYHQLADILRDPATYRSQTQDQARQADECTARFQQFLFSITNP